MYLVNNNLIRFEDKTEVPLEKFHDILKKLKNLRDVNMMAFIEFKDGSINFAHPCEDYSEFYRELKLFDAIVVQNVLANCVTSQYKFNDYQFKVLT